MAEVFLRQFTVAGMIVRLFLPQAHERRYGYHCRDQNATDNGDEGG